MGPLAVEDAVVDDDLVERWGGGAGDGGGEALEQVAGGHRGLGGREDRGVTQGGVARALDDERGGVEQEVGLEDEVGAEGDEGGGGGEELLVGGGDEGLVGVAGGEDVAGGGVDDADADVGAAEIDVGEQVAELGVERAAPREGREGAQGKGE